MPMRKAAESLHVFTEESASETPKPSPVIDVAQKKGTHRFPLLKIRLKWAMKFCHLVLKRIATSDSI